MDWRTERKCFLLLWPLQFVCYLDHKQCWTLKNAEDMQVEVPRSSCLESLIICASKQSLH